MKEHKLGIIMNGVTGRMGTNQHLIRSIVAIRDQGGIQISPDERITIEPILTGRKEEKLKALIIGTPGGLSGKIAQLKPRRSTPRIELTQETIATGSALLRPVSPMKVSVSPMRIMPPSSPRPETPRRAINSEDAQVLDFDG